MSHLQRLRKLEGRASKLGLDYWCPACGGPSPQGTGLVISPTLELNSPLCPACGLELGENGRPLAHLDGEGNLTLKILVLESPPFS